MIKKLYYHKTDGGAEYLTDTFVAWKHNGKSGREGTVNSDTKILICLDEKRPEIMHNAAEYDRAVLLDALKDIRHTVNTALLYKRINKGVAEDIEATINAAIQKAESV